MILPGDVNFVGTLYSLGATLSFTIAHGSIVRLRVLDRADAEIPYRARPNVRIGKVAWPLFAILGGLATGISFLVLVVQNPLTRWAGLGWMVIGLVGYVVYRRRLACPPPGDFEGSARLRPCSCARVSASGRPGDRRQAVG